MDRGIWWATVHAVTRVRHDLATKLPPQAEHGMVCACPVVTLWTVAHQIPLSIGFSRQEYYTGLPGPTPGDFPDPWIESMSPVAPSLQTDSLPLSNWGSPEQDE